MGRSAPKSHRGQGLVEFALVLPLLLIFFMGIIEFSRLFIIYTTVTSASREAARYGVSVGETPGGTPRYHDCTGIRDAARRVNLLSPLTTIAIDYDRNGSPLGNCASSPDLELGDRIVIQVVSPYEPLVPLIDLPSFNISSSTRRTILKDVYIE